MRTAQLPANERERLRALRALRIVDTPPEPAFNRVVEVAAHLFETPMALVTFVEADRQWCKARIGPIPTDLKREHAFCTHTILSESPLVIPDTHDDPRFARHPLVLEPPHLRFYAGVPLRAPQGHRIGSLCVLDTRPRQPTPEQLAALQQLAHQVELQLELRSHLVETDQSLDRLEEAAPAAEEVPPQTAAIDVQLTLGPEGGVDAIGPGVEVLTGYPAERLRTDRALAMSLLHPDDRPLLDLMALAPGAVQSPVSYRWKSSTGEWRWIELDFRIERHPSGAPRLVGKARPVRSDEPAAPPAAEVLGHGQTDVTRLGWDGAIQHASPELAEALGHDRGDLDGRSVVDLVHPDDAPIVRTVLATLARRRERARWSTLRARHRDETFRSIQVLWTPSDERAGATGLTLHVRDVTRWTDLQGKVHAQQHQLEQLAASRTALVRNIAELQRRRERLNALIVHDLKNPLGAILASASFLQEVAKLDELAEEAVQDIRAAGQDMHRMVLDLLDLSRSDHGRLHPRLQPVDLPKLLVQTEHNWKLRARERGMPVETTHERLSDPFVNADGDLIQRVLDNLLDNACKYGAPGCAIRIEARDASDGRVQITVSDAGPQVPAADREAVFTPEARLEGRRVPRACASRGLGLAFCRVAVEAHGGHIRIEDEPGGSRFSFSLPRVPPGAP
jgi:PAS domain S-box-containing protein